MTARRTAAARALAAEAPAFRRDLAGWFERGQRALPWRTERSLYRTVVSEFMLQQTQVATVLPYFERWMRALPDFAALAAADEATVLKLWEGLGYYRRARNLHRLARELVALPAPPSSAAHWRELPGIGPYTAAAIASIAGGVAAACVDGNVVRILARLTNDARPFPDPASAVKGFAPLAGALLDPAQPGRHNEAMMELGATVCRRGEPRCPVCPVAGFCGARRAGTAATIPRLARAAPERVAVDRIWQVRDGALLLHRAAGDAGRLAGLFELPTAAQAGVDATVLDAATLLATRRRSITRFQITERIHRPPGPLALDSASQAAGLAWVPLEKLPAISLSGPHRRWITALLEREFSASTPPESTSGLAVAETPDHLPGRHPQ